MKDIWGSDYCEIGLYGAITGDGNLWIGVRIHFRFKILTEMPSL